ncbi:hypothetical protein C6988_07860 [Nitrosopumilus sp. b1]|uniref:hypothetical protein n=1 Tax=Nitrosopumilus sp. b1 TaxID=2109907 RepID=UPI0015F437A0|nr:hypothetical protein [Nitrosopumilus sp. b1]KAF6242580.1 hypothetical protein C6988_07860 [Nitrosopumilus sp. b1]
MVRGALIASGIIMLIFSTVYIVDAYAQTVKFDFEYYFTNGTRSATVFYNVNGTCVVGETSNIFLNSTLESNKNFTATCVNNQFATSPILITDNSTEPEPKLLVVDNDQITAEASSIGSGIIDTSSVFTTYVFDDDGMYPSQPNYETIVTCTDTDGDQLCNAWERNIGLRIYHNGKTYFYGCGNYGPDPDCPDYRNKWDVYVELDWMPGHAPDAQALADVKDFFANAPTAKPIIIHFQVDEPIGKHYSEVVTAIAGNDTTDYTLLKKHYFGTQQDRDQEPDPSKENKYLTNKRQAFHYGLFASFQHPYVNSSGQAEIGGNDFVVTLGSFEKGVGSTDQQAATIIHELGHNLGLQHGGYDNINCKPNYYSVMNHLYQFPTLVNRNIDYSDGNYINITEGNANDTAGIGPGGVGKEIAWSGGTAAIPEFSPQGVDWNGDTVENTSADDLNNISSIPTCNGQGLTTLVAYDDWSLINFDMRSTSAFDDGTPISIPLPPTESAINKRPFVVYDYDGDYKTQNITNLALVDFSGAKPIELTDDDHKEMLNDRIESTFGLIPGEGGNIDKYKALVLNGNLEGLLSIIEGSGGGQLDSFISSIKKSTETGMKVQGIYDDYYLNGVLLPPQLQTANGVDVFDVMCKPTMELIYLDRGDGIEPICVHGDSFARTLDVFSGLIVEGPYLCEINDTLNPLNHSYAPTPADWSKLSSITYSTLLGGDGSTFDCQDYLDEFYQ